MSHRKEQPSPLPGAYESTAADLAATLAAIAAPDLFGRCPEPALAERRLRFRRRAARSRRRDAVAAFLAEPWLAAAGTCHSARVARRLLRLRPFLDRPDPDRSLLTVPQQSAAWHAEEDDADRVYGRAVPGWDEGW